ncbi:CobW family GTP-binding protein [Nocardioides stalactiti]|uniref:CobW family GTP-binding protein n=1 Tax=Nocardioides stalactiti TaxID=2755356 RepID=UPI001602959B|nr:GTP-binding protein [Nocardioides stalactiti]
MRTPVVLVTGVDPDAMAATAVGLQFGLPGAVAVRHHIDVEHQLLTRTVSDLTGVLERQDVELEHACVPCAIREDVLPTLERLARARRWSGIVAHLPVGAECAQLCTVLDRDTRLARVLRVSTVVAALDARDPVHDLLGDDLLAERGLETSREDRRSVGEVLAAMVEYADAVVLDGAATPLGRGLVEALAQPEAIIVGAASDLDTDVLVDGAHQHSRTAAWTTPVRRDSLPSARTEGIWQVDLHASRPFHPGRLLECLELLGTGAHRSRGCFWLPSRPDRAHRWDGAGGQLSIGDLGPWRGAAPLTRIVLTGIGIAPAGLRDSFDRLLCGAEELHRGWQVSEDGFEPWLGPIRGVA